MTDESAAREKIARTLHDNRITQRALAILSGVSEFSLSSFLNGASVQAEPIDRMLLSLGALVEFNDENRCFDWRRVREVLPNLQERVARIRRERSAELYKRYTETTTYA